MRTILLLIVTACSLSLLSMGRAVAAAEPAPPQENDPVLATVGDHPIRQSDLDRLIEQVQKTGQPAWTTNQLMEELIRRQSIRAFILGSDVKIETSAVDAKLAEFQQQIVASGLAFDDFLDRQCLTKEELRQILFIQVGLETLAESRITDEELSSLNEEVSASHILIMTEGAPGVPPGGGLSDEDAKAKIVSIKKEIDEGRPFGECAKAYSDCRSKEQGGKLGYFPRYGAMVEPFAEAAYALKVGKVSEPVKTRFGYHLIMTTDRRKTSDEKKALAKTRLRNLKVVELLKEIRETVKVERFYKQDAAETQETPTENTD